MLDQKFYTTEQVANVLQVHPFTILKFIKQGKLNGIKIGRMYRIQESEVKRFLEERMTSASVKPSKAKKELKKKEPEIKTKVEIQSQTLPEEETFKDSYSLSDNNNDQGGQYYII